MNFKRILKWVGIGGMLLCTYLVCNELFLRQWRLGYYERKLKTGIVKNYNDNKSQFIELKKYVKRLNLRPHTRIEFRKNNIIRGYVVNRPRINFLERSLHFFSHSPDDTDEFQSEFELLHNGNALIETKDGKIEVDNWSWNFEGDPNHEYYDKFLTYNNITNSELDTLRTLIKRVNCSEVTVHNNSSMTIYYQENYNQCHTKYYFTAEDFIPNYGYEKIENGTYHRVLCGFYCGSYTLM